MTPSTTSRFLEISADLKTSRTLFKVLGISSFMMSCTRCLENLLILAKKLVIGLKSPLRPFTKMIAMILF